MENVEKRLAPRECPLTNPTLMISHFMTERGPPTPPLRRPGRPVFFWEASRASPQHGWRSAYSLRETLSPTQDTGPLVVSRESGAPADQVEETPGRASLEKLACRTPPQLHAGEVGRQQQQHGRTRSFIYADDLCGTAQYSSFTEVERTIGDALDKLTQYYRSNSLRANPDKTQVTAFYLRNKEEKR